MAGVDIKGAVKRYGNVQVLHGIDLEIRDGEFVVFVGPSGCGKSTLLRMIAGLESISGGTIEIGGRVMNDVPPRGRDIAMVFQDYALYPHLSVFENMAFGLRLRKAPKAEVETAVKRAAGILKIDHLLDRKPRALSGGQRQRVAMGRAIVRDPQVFLFDEPLSNLDALLRSEMRVEIKRLHQQLKTTTIYVTHDQVEAMTLADKIVVLKGGDIQQVGSPDDIYNRPANLFVAGFTGSPPMNVIDATVQGDGLQLAEGITLPLPAALRNAHGGRDGQAVKLGIRPEHMSLAGDGPSFTLPVSLVEPLGSDTLAFLTLGSREIVARFTPDEAPRAGDRVTVHLQSDKLHLFDAQTGATLTHR
ncbi:ABC transporter ATP-binding protein [Lacibacterium aquatile]|uniref:ABC transporter ATP-binding protein n=1 Tax=Lacibacterium aquatile TaxID=1168082 RepID=A0ABW5DYS0_9PROT